MSEFSRDDQSVKRFAKTRAALTPPDNKNNGSEVHNSYRIKLRQRVAEAIPEFFRVLNQGIVQPALESTKPRGKGRKLGIIGLAGLSLFALAEQESSIIQRLPFASPTSSEPEHTNTLLICTNVVVQQGENLWVIGRELQPEGDLRPTIDSLVKQLGGESVVHPGDELKVCVPERPETEQAGS